MELFFYSERSKFQGLDYDYSTSGSKLFCALSMHSLVRVVRIPIHGGRSAGPGLSLEVDIFKVGIFSEM